MNKWKKGHRQIFGAVAERCESGKVCYDKRGAQTTKNARYHRDHVELRIYPCNLGNHWHVTSQIHIKTDPKKFIPTQKIKVCRECQFEGSSHSFACSQR